MPKNNTISVFVIIGLCAALVFAMATWLGPNSNSAAPKTQLTDAEKLPAPLNSDQLKAYQVSMTNETNPVAVMKTNHGTIEIELFSDTMPVTTQNFISLAESGFYDGTKFHRVIENFMIQSGDPLTKTDEAIRYGTGGPDYTIPDEHIAGKYLTNVRGTIAMANRGPNSGGSQYFINLVDNTNLDFDKEPLTSKHPVFGRVLKGMDVVDEIGSVDTNENNLPLEPVIVESITIRRP